MRDHEVSRTAYGIAVGLYLLSRDPRFAKLVPEKTARLSAAVADDLASPLLRKLISVPSALPLFDGLERFVLKGARLHFALRKRWIECRVRAELERGKRQLVVLAAGFDSLAWRLQEEFPDRVFIEIDSSPTQRHKRDALQRLGFDERNLELVPADFTKETLEHVLARSRLWNESAPALFLAEGLFMYLPLAVLCKLARTLAGPPGSDRTMIFSCLDKEDRTEVGFRAANPWLVHWLRWRGEPLQSAFDELELTRFLGDAGWNLVEKASDTEWDRGITLPLAFPAVVGETLVVAARNPLQSSANLG